MANKRKPTQQGVLVLGMHRSGTSATAGALEAAGFRLGDRLIEGAVDNPGGYFEHAGVVDVHERLLDALGRAWDDVRAMPAGWPRAAPSVQAAQSLGEILAGELAGKVPWVIKDPRACRLLPLWDKVLASQGTQVGCLFVMRHPDEVAASLWARDRLPATVSHVLWLRHMVEAEAASRGWPRVLLQYADLLDAPGKVLAGALQHLGLTAPGGLAGASGRVDTKARHHDADASGEAGPWRTLAVEAFETARSSGSVDTIAGVTGAIRALEQEHAAWLEVVGAVQASGQARIARWKTEASSSAGIADRLQGHLDEISGLSLSRLREIETLDAQLSRTTEALRKAEGLVETLQGDFARVDAALEQTKTLANERLGELKDATERAARAEEAKNAAEGVVEALGKEARTLTGALSEAQAFAEERLQALEAAEAQLRSERDAWTQKEAEFRNRVSTEAEARAAAEKLLGESRKEAGESQAAAAAEAKARAEAEKLLAESRASAEAETKARGAAEKLLADSRKEAGESRSAAQAETKARAAAEAILADVRTELDSAQLRATVESAARERVEALALERLAAVEDLDRRLVATTAAKELAERLAYERQEELDALAGEIERMLEALHAAGQRHDEMAERLALLEHGRWSKLGRRLGVTGRPPEGS